MNLKTQLQRTIGQMKKERDLIRALNCQTGDTPQTRRVGRSSNGKYDVWVHMNENGNFSAEGIDWDALDREMMGNLEHNDGG